MRATTRTVDKRDTWPHVVEARPLCFVIHKVEPDNVSDHRAGMEILQAEKSTRKSGFACITLLSVAVANEIDLNGGLKQDVNYRSLRRRFPSGDI